MWYLQSGVGYLNRNTTIPTAKRLLPLLLYGSPSSISPLLQELIGSSLRWRCRCRCRCGISHGGGSLVRLLVALVQPLIRRLLLLLHQVAEAAAACGSDVRNAVSLEVVLGPDVGALHAERNPPAADTAGGKGQQTLLNRPGLVHVRDSKQENDHFDSQKC